MGHYRVSHPARLFDRKPPRFQLLEQIDSRAGAPRPEGVGNDCNRPVGPVAVRLRPNSPHPVERRQTLGADPFVPRIQKGRRIRLVFCARASDGQGNQKLLGERIPAIHDIQMNRPPRLVVLPMSPFEHDSRLIGEKPEPPSEGLSVAYALFGRERVINPIVGQGMIAKVAALAVGDERAVTPLPYDRLRIFPVLEPPLALDQVCQTAVHQVFRN